MYPFNPSVCGGKVPSQRVADRRKQKRGGLYTPTHPEHPPGWPVPYCLSQAPQAKTPTTSSSAKHPAHLKYTLLSLFNLHQFAASTMFCTFLINALCKMYCYAQISLSVTCYNLYQPVRYLFWGWHSVGKIYNLNPQLVS